MCVLLDALGPALREATPMSAHGEAGGLRGHNLVQHSFVGLVQQSIRQAEMPKPPASPWCSQTAFIPRTSLRRTCGPLLAELPGVWAYGGVALPPVPRGKTRSQLAAQGVAKSIARVDNTCSGPSSGLVSELFVGGP